MLNYKSILIAVDGSQEAEWAFQKSLDIALRNNAKLSIINIIDNRSFASVETFDHSIEKRAHDFSYDLLDGYEKIAQDRGLKEIDKIIDYGSPKRIIPIKAVERTNADLIVCGSSGLNAVERFIVGSVSESIVRNAKVDVLVVRTESIPEDFDPVVSNRAKEALKEKKERF